MPSQKAAHTDKPLRSLSLKFAATGTVITFLCLAVVFSGWLNAARSDYAVLLCPFLVAAGIAFCMSLLAGAASLTTHEGSLVLAVMAISFLGLAALVLATLITAFLVMPFPTN